ncbi:MAG TPA: trypsin-like peptidase domain-containing protein [Candidatus Acidoferrum sp.]|nr:trypsin-like peptidase domain-containing protein [Candidatus Acidoferrum sp.]
MLESEKELPITEESKVATIEVGVPHPVIKKYNFGPSLKVFGIVCLCVASSAITAWLLLLSGYVKPNVAQTIADNRQKIVMQQGDVISTVFKQVSPSTVAITTQASLNNGFFGTTTEQGAGSGIVISADGYILTNKHVVPDGTSQVTVVLSDGRQFTNVSVVGRDPSNDIAFLKIQGVNNLTPATIGDSSKVAPGQSVVAIGNALGQFRNSVTSGIISGIGRPVAASDDSGGSEQLEDLFQTDAAINPGNSGGPLVDLTGQVIGINTAVAQDGQSIGFAIPINDAKSVISSIIKQGKIVKAYLGLRYIDLTQETAAQLHITTTTGVYVTGDANDPAVVPGGPADKAGLQNHDIITKVNGRALSNSFSLAAAIAQFNPGDSATLTILRGSKEQALNVTFGSYPGL